MKNSTKVTDLSTGRSYQVRTQDIAHAKAMSLAMRSASVRMGRAIARDMARRSEINTRKRLRKVNRARFEPHWLVQSVPFTENKMIGGGS